MVAQPQGVSLNPETFVQGGLIDQANLLISDASFAVWDYDGKSPQPTIAAKLTLKADDDTEYTQWYSAGDPKNFAPSMDGSELVPLSGATALNENSNFAFFLKQMISAGFPASRLTSKITDLKGLYAFWRRVPAPERAGLAPRAGQEGRRNDILVPTMMHNLPWEPAKRGTPAMQATNAAVGVPAAPVNGAAPAAAAAAAAPPQGSSLPAGVTPEQGQKAATWLAAKLTTMPILALSDATSAAFQDNAADPDRNAIVQCVYDANWLRGAGAASGWSFDGTNIQKV